MEQNSNSLVEVEAGGQTLAAPTGTKNHQDDGKNFVQKAKRRLTEREAEEWNALLKQKAPICEVDAGEAALDDLGDYQDCLDLAGKFAGESAKRIGDLIADVRDRYEAIALGFLCARGEQSCKAPLALGSALNALAEEYARDRKGLLRFLDAVFKRWQKIDQPGSLFGQRVIIHQHLGKPKVVAEYLENSGAVSKCTTAEQVESLHARIKQYRSRDRKNALKKRQKAW